MTRTEELLALAEAAIKERPARNRLYKLQDTADPETIKQLIALCKLQHEVLLEFKSMSVCDEAIAAFNKFEGGV